MSESAENQKGYSAEGEGDWLCVPFAQRAMGVGVCRGLWAGAMSGSVASEPKTVPTNVTTAGGQKKITALAVKSAKRIYLKGKWSHEVR